MKHEEHEANPRKANRRRTQQAERERPIVHGVLPYLGHRPRPKDERRRLADLVRQARRKA